MDTGQGESARFAGLVHSQNVEETNRVGHYTGIYLFETSHFEKKKFKTLLYWRPYQKVIFVFQKYLLMVRAERLCDIKNFERLEDAL